jgi:hypothetical protein
MKRLAACVVFGVLLAAAGLTAAHTAPPAPSPAVPHGQPFLPAYMEQLRNPTPRGDDVCEPARTIADLMMPCGLTPKDMP